MARRPQFILKYRQSSGTAAWDEYYGPFDLPEEAEAFEAKLDERTGFENRGEVCVLKEAV